MKYRFTSFTAAVTAHGMCLLLCALGCGGGGLDGIVPIRGSVTYNGEPLTNARVRFVPLDEAEGRVATGELDAGGNFVLTTLKANDGALPGEYRVLILAFDPASGGPNDPEARNRKPDMPYHPKSRIPEKYANSDETPLKFVVSRNGPRTVELVIDGMKK